MNQNKMFHIILGVFFLVSIVSLWAGNTIIKDSVNEEIQKELQFLQAESDVIYAATKSEIPLSKAPGAVSVINYEQIRKSGARTIPELLRLVPGVNIRWTPMMQKIDIRGFGTNPFTSQVLLLIDGVPYNSWNKGGFPQQPGFDFFILQNVKRLEIIRNPGSVLYGENAYRGVINIVTLSGADIDGGKIEIFGGDLKSRNIGGIFGKDFGDYSLLFSGKLTRGQMPLEYFRESESVTSGSDIFIKGTYKDFELSYYRHEDTFDGFSDQLTPTQSFSSINELDQIIDILAMKFDHKTESKGFSFGGDVSWAKRDGIHCGSCHAAKENPVFSKKSDHGYQLIGDFRMGIHTIPLNNILIGIESRHVDAGDHSDELVAEGHHIPSGTDVVHDYDKNAIYIQDQISLLDDKLNITAGVRYDAETNSDIFGEQYSPRIAFVYNLTDAITLRSSWSKAFRTPSFGELYQDSGFINFDDGKSPPLTLAEFEPNPALDPEEIETYDIGIEYKFTSKMSLKLDTFYSEVENYIVTVLDLTTFPSHYKFENHPDDAITYGSELEFRWEATRRITGFINWTYQESKRDKGLLDSTGIPIEFTYQPQHMVNVGFFFRPFIGLSGALELSWKDRYQAARFWYTILGVPPQPLNDYTIINLRLNYEFPNLTGRNLKNPVKLSFYVKNLLDKRQPETLIGIDSSIAGRSFFGGIEFQF